MEEKSKFAHFLATKRGEAGLTQKELAQQLFVSDTAVSKWERGISYPDITLVSAICKELTITEHEFMTACDDRSARLEKKQAKRYRTFIRTYHIVMCSLYGIALLTCFICNLAIEHGLSWFFLVLSSIALAFSITNLPLLLKKHKAVLTFATASLLLLVLLTVCCIYVQGDWLFSVAFPSALLPLALAWGIMLIIRYLNAPWQLKTGISTFLFGLFAFIVNPYYSLVTRSGNYTIGQYFQSSTWLAPLTGDTLSLRLIALIAGGLLVCGLVFSVLGAVRMLRTRKTA